MLQHPTHQSILAFDIEGFGDPHRAESAQLAIRSALFRLVRQSLESSGVTWDSCGLEDRGDGAIVLVPAEVPKVLLLDPLLGLLSAALREHNRLMDLSRRIRLRMAVHSGEVAQDAYGAAGSDLVLACRLLDATPLRHALRHATTDLAVILSDSVYDAVVRRGYRHLDSTRFHPTSVRVKNTRTHGWIHLPGSAAPPALSVDEDVREAPPRQLLPSPDFVGRANELRALDLAMAENVRVVVLVGPPGVGKTALALHWAHRASSHFDDGQLYVDLGGSHSTNPLGQAEVLERFLKALGVPAQRVPIDLVEQAALYRSLTADRRLLVVLDNAPSTKHVRPLLPASRRSMVVITSGTRLGSLVTQGARFIEVEHLTQTESVDLLAKLVGGERIGAEPVQAERLADLCGRLPIALCVGGARLASHPRWPVERAVVELVDERERLAHLSYGEDLSVQAVFDMSYQALSPSAAHLYRLLGLHPGSDFAVRLAGVVLGTTSAEGAGLVDELQDASLLEEISTDRFRFHDLVRLHALQQADLSETTDSRALAVRRVLDWYLDTATRAGAVATPHRKDLRRDIRYAPVDPMSFDSHASALGWFEQERLNLLAATRYAATHELPVLAWQLADSMWGLFLYRTHYRDQMEFDLLAVDTSRVCGDRFAEAEAQDRLGLLYHALGRNDEALERFGSAADIWRELDDRHRMAGSVERFGFAYLDQGDWQRAVDCFGRALVGYEALGEQRSVGLALISTGRALIAAGRFEEAGRHLTRAHTVLDSLATADPYNTARALIAWGRAETKARRHLPAHERLDAALRTMRAVHSPLGEADALHAIAELHEQEGDISGARHHFEQALVLLEGLGNSGAPQVRDRLDALDQ